MCTEKKTFLGKDHLTIVVWGEGMHLKECKWGFEIRLCTRDHPQVNGIPKRFMGVLVKVVHAAVDSKQDPRVEVKRKLLNDRITLPPSTGKPRARLMTRRQIKTSMMKPTKEKVDKEDKVTDKDAMHRHEDKGNTDDSQRRGERKEKKQV